MNCSVLVDIVRHHCDDRHSGLTVFHHRPFVDRLTKHRIVIVFVDDVND